MTTMDKDFKMVKSVYTSNHEAITNIMHLYGIERFDLDCTYSKGNFWKGLPDPVHKTDLYPHYDHVIEANSEDLPFESGSMKTSCTTHHSLSLVVGLVTETIEKEVLSLLKDLRVTEPTMI